MRTRSQTNDNKRKRPENDDGSYSDDRNEPKPKPEAKPRLTTPDLEFDFDRTQLRDPRLTPGRKARPRHDQFHIDMDKSLKARLESEFIIPKPEQPKGRLNVAIKNDLSRQESLMNPAAYFHDIRRCRQKGPNGSPTYDAAGFELDFDKVCRWHKPQTYNKRSMVNNMTKAIDETRAKEEQIASLFFKSGSKEATENITVILHVEDQVSKDIGVPFHQIGPAQVQQWREKGFEPVDFDTWWKKPNEIERHRMSKMTLGSLLRKRL